MAARGGARAGAGRPKGAPNKATADIKDAASEYSDAALKVLVRVMGNTEAPAAAQVAAANAILDRAHGKPKQSMEVDATVSDLSPEERKRRIDNLIAKAAGRADGG